ncbi:hypothetical protein T459_22280 [Capsicum annuum]|uniref:Adhesive plaque matrix protein-like n=1 Tax=Capsicum annuum TaxID=4072 RepID=A0A2G2YZ46_CAPAN|nr:hypothetical protein T459_22280 [Capsicum annuum]
MASYGRGGGFNTYNEVQPYEDDWGKPITTMSDYPDHVCRPVIVDVQGSRNPIVSYSTEHGVKGYVVRAQRVVEVRRSYDIPMNGLLDEYNGHEEWDDHSPRKVNDFFDRIHSEVSRPTHSTLLSPPKLITKKPSWISEDQDSPKYREHRDFSGSPLRNKFEGLHLQDNRGSSPFKYSDGYVQSMDSPKSGHVKDYGVNNTWDSPPRSTHGDWDSRRSHDDYVKSPYSNNKDDYGKPKFNGATNDIGTAMRILQEDSPTSNPTPQRKESYPESAHGAKPVFSPFHTQQQHSPTSNPTPQKKESYPETAYSPKPLFPPVYSQQPHSSTSNPIPPRKESYPETTPGPKPLFSPVYSQQQPHSPTSNPITQRKESYPETNHGPKPLFSPVYTPQSHLPTSNPIPQKKESYPETNHGPKPLFSPVYKPQSHSPTSNPTPQRKESYPETAHGIKPVNPAYTPQSYSPTSNPTSQRKESYPATAHDTNPMFSPVSTQPSHFSTANPPSQNNESNPKKTKGWKSLFSSSPKQQSTPEMKQSYPDHETQGWKPSFSTSSPQKEHYTPQMEDHYPNQIQRGDPFPPPYEIAQYGTIAPPKETIDSSEARKKYANLKPSSPSQMKYSGTIDSREAVKKYNGAFVP